MGSRSIGEYGCDSPQRSPEHGNAGTEHRPVKGGPVARVDGSHRPQRGQRGQSHGHAGGQERAEGHTSEETDQPVTSGGPRTGPKGAHHAALLVPEAQLAGDRLGPR